MPIITGWKLIGIGLLAAFISLVFYLASCERIVYWPGCEEYRDIPVLPQLILPLVFSAVLLWIVGGIMNAVRKPEFPSDSENIR